MQGNLSDPFTEAFVTTCLEAGVSKSATAELLVRQSVVTKGAESPGFAKGYEKVASRVGGGLIPRVSPGFFLKVAAIPSGTLRTGLREVMEGFKGVGRGLRGTVKGTVGRVAPPKTFLQDTIRKYPVRSFVGGIGAAGLGTYGVSRMLGHGSGLNATPYLPSGGYNPQESEKMRVANAIAISRGVYDLNRAANPDSGRRQVLQRAVDSNDVNSGMALQELRKLDADASGGRLKQKAYGDKLTAEAAKAQQRLGDLAKVKDQRTSMWRAPLRWIGAENAATYDEREMRAQDQSSQAAENLRLNTHAQRLLKDEVIGKIETTPAPSQATQFFPTY